MAESGQSVYLPLTFHAEAGPVQTTACFEVLEYKFGQSVWWKKTSNNKGAVGHAFKSVINAIKMKDRAKLFELSDPVHGRDKKRFDEQASALFQQLEALEMVSVPRAYELNGLVIFYAEIRSRGRTLYAPFTFMADGNGGLGYLPYRTDRISYLLVKDWFNSAWGPAVTKHPGYCAEEKIKTATHRFIFDPDTQVLRNGQDQSHLFLSGFPLDGAGSSLKGKEQILATIESMKEAISKEDINEFIKYLTPEGGDRLKGWFLSAGQDERDKYISAFTEQQPYFLFDETPLLVIYTMTPSSGSQVMYFTKGNNKKYLWTNSSHVTDVDKIFKMGSMYDAAMLDKPFSNIRIK